MRTEKLGWNNADGTEWGWINAEGKQPRPKPGKSPWQRGWKNGDDKMRKNCV